MNSIYHYIKTLGGIIPFGIQAKEPQANKIKNILLLRTEKKV